MKNMRVLLAGMVLGAASLTMTGCQSEEETVAAEPTSVGETAETATVTEHPEPVTSEEHPEAATPKDHPAH